MLAETDEERSDFPLFSQKDAGKTRLQMKVRKRFGVVSTDSQESSQQQGFIFVFQDKSPAEEVVVLDFAVNEKTDESFCQREESSLRDISTVVRERHRVGLYTLRKSE